MPSETATKKRRAAKRTTHIWEVTVRHKDTHNPGKTLRGEFYMAQTTLLIRVQQRRFTLPDCELSISRANSFLRKHSGAYQICTIREVKYIGEVDN